MDKVDDIQGRDDIISSTEPPKNQVISSSLPELDEINKRYDEIKQANDRLATELLRSEELRTRQLMGGKSSAGQNKTPQEIQNESIDAEVEKIVKSLRV